MEKWLSKMGRSAAGQGISILRDLDKEYVCSLQGVVRVHPLMSGSNQFLPGDPILQYSRCRRIRHNHLDYVCEANNEG